MFETLNKWLKSDNIEMNYQFNMLTPGDYSLFFDRLRKQSLQGYRSHLDVKILEIYNMEDECFAEFDELDIVKVTAKAYESEGLSQGEKGTIVLVHTDNGKRAYEVEFDNWTKKFPIKVKTLTGDEIEMVTKWHS